MSIPVVGLVFRLDGHYVLVHGPGAAGAAATLAGPLFGPPVFVRPGYRYFAENTYLLPTQAIDDFGQVYEPPDCYEWIETRGDAFPRADVLGRTPAGERRSAFMKQLDLANMALFASPGADDPQVYPLSLVLAAADEAGPERPTRGPAGCPPGLELFARGVPCRPLAPGAPAAPFIRQLLSRQAAK